MAAGTYGRTGDKARMAKDAETMLGNGLATILAITAGILGGLGLLVGFDVINVENPFESGLLWLASGIVSGLCANVFRPVQRNARRLFLEIACADQESRIRHDDAG